MSEKEMSFWEHLDDLRGSLLKAIGVYAAALVPLFIFMPDIFDKVLLAPCRGSFFTYRLLDRLATLSPMLGEAATSTDFNITLINFQLASQFFIHISASCWIALILTFPVILYLIWQFISPGLYAHEKKGASRAYFSGIFLFYIGVAICYFIVFPLSVRFLATYQLSDLVPNHISLDSYMDTFYMLSLMMGLVFELPVLSYFLGKAGLVTRKMMKKYRRHAIVALVILAAVITPTGDPFTLAVVFVPLYVLYELSLFTIPKK